MDQSVHADARKESLPEPERPEDRHAPLSVGAFVVVLAGLMAVNPLAVDIMLPAYPQIADAMGGIEITRMQTMITFYMFGFALSQLFVGFLADRYGRKVVLIVGLVIYMIAGGLAAVASDFTMLLVARFIQGIGSGAPRIAAQASIRDCYSGRQMARIMSLVMTVFLVVPVLAPSIGQAVLLVSSWHWVFASLSILGAVLLVVSTLYFPETLPPARRRVISIPAIADAMSSIFLNPQTIGYTLAAGAFFGSMFGFIGTAQPVMADHFGLGLYFPIVFAALAVGMSISSFLNSRLVERFGMRLLSHAATMAFTLDGLAMVILAESGLLTVWIFIPMMTLNMLFTGLVFSNFNALAMEPQGHVAGVASSFVSAVTVVLGAVIGYVIGDNYDGTATPLVIGFATCGAGTLIVLLITEKGRLFQPSPERR